MTESTGGFSFVSFPYFDEEGNVVIMVWQQHRYRGPKAGGREAPARRDFELRQITDAYPSQHRRDGTDGTRLYANRTFHEYTGIKPGDLKFGSASR